MNKLIKHSLNAVILLFLFTTLGCSSKTSEGVTTQGKTLLVNNSLCSFSFEIPPGFKIGDIFLENNIREQYFSVDLNLPEVRNKLLKEFVNYYSPGNISITVNDALNSDANIQSTISLFLEQAGKWDNFALLDDSEKVIDGIICRQLTYNDHMGSSPETSWNRKLFFIYDGYIWTLGINCDTGLKDSLSLQFESVVNSFQILK